MLGVNTVIFVICLGTLAIVHYLAIELYLYWRYLWLDIPVHFFAGAIASLGLFSLSEMTSHFPKRFLSLLPVVLFVIGVALLWEIFELKAGIPVEENFELDLVIDLIMGTAGGLIGYYVGSSFRKIQV